MTTKGIYTNARIFKGVGTNALKNMGIGTNTLKIEVLRII
jgi:hypothetical protein